MKHYTVIKIFPGSGKAIFKRTRSRKQAMKLGKVTRSQMAILGAWTLVLISKANIFKMPYSNGNFIVSNEEGKVIL